MALLSFSACSQESRSGNIDYAGEYVFSPGSEEIPSGTANYLVLRSDGTAAELHYDRPTGRIKVKESLWKSEDGSSGPEIVVGDRGYPIDASNQRVRLYVNYDLDMYFEKVR